MTTYGYAITALRWFATAIFTFFISLILTTGTRAATMTPPPVATNSMATSEPATSDSAQRQELLQMLKGVNLEPFPDVLCAPHKALCQQFLADFMQQNQIEYVQPIIQADSYDDPAFKPYKERCPKLVLNRHMYFLPGQVDDLSKMSEEEQEANAIEISYGVSNFKLYKLDLGSDFNPSVLYVFYEQGQRITKPVTRAGTATDSHSGTYIAVDFDACKTRGGASAGGHFANHTTADYHGVIKYRGKYYIVEFASAQPSIAQLTATGFLKSKTGVIETGVEFSYFSPRRPSH